MHSAHDPHLLSLTVANSDTVVITQFGTAARVRARQLAIQPSARHRPGLRAQGGFCAVFQLYRLELFVASFLHLSFWRPSFLSLSFWRCSFLSLSFWRPSFLSLSFWRTWVFRVHEGLVGRRTILASSSRLASGSRQARVGTTNRQARVFGCATRT
jgi:hypothetical protein